MTDSDSRPQPLAVAQRAFAAEHVLRHPLFHQRAFRIGKRLQHVAPGTGESALVTGLLFPLQCASHFVGDSKPA